MTTAGKAVNTGGAAQPANPYKEALLDALGEGPAEQDAADGVAERTENSLWLEINRLRIENDRLRAELSTARQGMEFYRLRAAANEEVVAYCRVEDWQHTSYPEGCFIHELDENDNENEWVPLVRK